MTPSAEGRRQFFEQQSQGVRPERPDPYYELLSDGKWTFDFMFSELRDSYRRGHWCGLRQLWEDWEGDRWLLPHLLRWWERETGRPLPNWLSVEEEYLGP